MYLFLTSKSAKADKIGDSALRDNMVTSFVFKTKVHNARTFFKDTEKERLLKALRNPGDAIFTNRRDDSVVLTLPLATRRDMTTIARMVGSQDLKGFPQPFRSPVQEGEPGQEGHGVVATESPIPPNGPPVLTPEVLKQRRQQLGLSLQDLVDRTGVKHKMQLSRFEHGSQTLTQEEQTQVLQILFPKNGHKKKLLQPL
jgi:hypothetical protein